MASPPPYNDATADPAEKEAPPAYTPSNPSSSSSSSSSSQQPPTPLKPPKKSSWTDKLKSPATKRHNKVIAENFNPAVNKSGGEEMTDEEKARILVNIRKNEMRGHYLWGYGAGAGGGC